MNISCSSHQKMMLLTHIKNDKTRKLDFYFTRFRRVIAQKMRNEIWNLAHPKTRLTSRGLRCQNDDFLTIFEISIKRL